MGTAALSSKRGVSSLHRDELARAFLTVGAGSFFREKSIVMTQL
jgi:hypothetical protein